MIIITQISFKEYRSLLFKLAYNKPIMRIILFVAFVMLVWILGYYSISLPIPKPEIYQYITLVLILFVQPFVIYWTIRRNYLSSNHLSEKLKIEIEDLQIKIKGQSFYTELNWKNIFKVEELTNWILIYQNTFSAIIIQKRNFKEDQLAEFKRIVLKQAKVPANFKST